MRPVTLTNAHTACPRDRRSERRGSTFRGIIPTGYRANKKNHAPPNGTRWALCGAAASLLTAEEGRRVNVQWRLKRRARHFGAIFHGLDG